MYNIKQLNNFRHQNNIINRTFKIAIWNIHKLAKNWQEIKTFIFSQNIDILLLSETYFINKSYFRILEYILYHIMYFDGKGHERTALITRSIIRYYIIGK
jgi:hypothetical protein